MGRKWINDFQQKLRYSLEVQQKFDIAILKNHIPDCVSIEKTDEKTDKQGIDYVATLKNGAKIYIDAKTREKGCSRYWRGEPELAIETYSVIKEWNGIEIGNTGWTFKTDSDVDYILYTFPEKDCKEFFFIPFQLLRKAAIENYHLWKSKFPTKRQANKSYQSEAMFVPANVVLEAVTNTMRDTNYQKE